MTPTPERVLVAARAILAEMLEHEPYVIGYEAASLRCALAAEKARPTSAIIAQVQGSDVAVEKATPGSSWSPIETAPRDGSELWGWLRHPGDEICPEPFERASAIYWDEGCANPGFERAPGWEAKWVGTPTHWQPLPASPSGAAHDAAGVVCATATSGQEDETPTHRDFRIVAEDEALLAEVAEYLKDRDEALGPTDDDVHTPAERMESAREIMRIASRLRSQLGGGR